MADFEDENSSLLHFLLKECLQQRGFSPSIIERILKEFNENVQGNRLFDQKFEDVEPYENDLNFYQNSVLLFNYFFSCDCKLESLTDVIPCTQSSVHRLLRNYTGFVESHVTIYTGLIESHMTIFTGLAETIAESLISEYAPSLPTQSPATPIGKINEYQSAAGVTVQADSATFLPLTSSPSRTPHAQSHVAPTIAESQSAQLVGPGAAILSPGTPIGTIAEPHSIQLLGPDAAAGVTVQADSAKFLSLTLSPAWTPHARSPATPTIGKSQSAQSVRPDAAVPVTPIQTLTSHSAGRVVTFQAASAPTQSPATAIDIPDPIPELVAPIAPTQSPPTVIDTPDPTPELVALIAPTATPTETIAESQSTQLLESVPTQSPVIAVDPTPDSTHGLVATRSPPTPTSTEKKDAAIGNVNTAPIRAGRRKLKRPESWVEAATDTVPTRADSPTCQSLSTVDRQKRRRPNRPKISP